MVAAERHGAVLVAIRAIKGPERGHPVGARVEAIRVVEDVARLVPHVAHDLAAVFEVVDRALEPAEVRIGEIERDAEHRLHVRTAPLVGEVADGPELVEAAALELLVELAYVGLDGRPLEPQPQLADALAKYAAKLRIERFECRHLCT